MNFYSVINVSMISLVVAGVGVVTGRLAFPGLRLSPLGLDGLVVVLVLAVVDAVVVPSSLG